MTLYIEERNPFFDIKSEPIITESGLRVGKNALVNSETDDVLGVVSPKYYPITNGSVDGLFSEALKGLEVAKITDHMDAITKKWKRRIVFKDGSLNFNIADSDVVGVMLEIYNGYDGKTAFGFSLMGYRWVCTNGLVMGKKEIFSSSYSHFIDNPEKLRNDFEMKFNNFKNVADVWKQWNNDEFTQDDFDKFVDLHTKPDTGKIKKEQYLGKKLSIALKESYRPILEHQELHQNKWGAFNVMTWMSTHETKARKGSNVFSQGYKTIERLAEDFYIYSRNN